MAPVELNIVCFRYHAAEPNRVRADQVNEEIVIKLQESGTVAPSTTTIAGRVAIRAAIVNHRTSRTEIDALVDGALTHGRALWPVIVQKSTKKSRELPSYEVLSVALEVVNQRLTSQPRSTELLSQRGNLLELMGRSVEALDTYSRLLELDPTHRGALNNLGTLLSGCGKNTAAREAYGRAAASYPGDPMSQVNYANSLRKNGDLENAGEHFQLALDADPDNWQAHLGMSSVLADRGDAERASAHRRAAFRGRCVVPLTYRGQQAPITVLELVAIGAGNTRFKNFLSDRIFKRYLVAAEFYEPGTALPPHQIVVNTIGDAECAGPALLGAQALLAHTAAPVVNAPEAVLATSRCEIAQRLAGLPGVITATTVTLSREVLSAPDVLPALTRHGLAFPLLLRTPGFHQGEHFVRVESFAEFPAALATLPGHDLTVMQYLDARGRDGKSRKYRAMMIDGQLYPLHAAVSSHWKIHYFSAEMADFPEHRAEDAEFLGNMVQVLGPRAMAALEAIQVTLGLDYGGIDFGLNQQGDVLVFEANATMAVIPPAEDQRWDYRRPAVARICSAVNKMLMKRASIGFKELAAIPA
jgi:tetratricopeptide (TPR) repeat protein